MRIAYLSFEYPPDNAAGGIATYVHQAAHLMAARGHDIEVFAGSGRRTETESIGGVRVHWCRESEPWRFRDTVFPVFAARHKAEAFDVIEGPEFNADAARVKEQFPELPLVVKMHSPSRLIAEINDVVPSNVLRWLRRIARLTLICVGKLRRSRGQPIEAFCVNPWKRNDRIEQAHAGAAEIIASPSLDLLGYARERWGIPAFKMLHVPYPYIPTPEYLEIPCDTNTGRIAFLGRLETRKGVLDLAAAIPLVLKRCPQATFRFIGRNCRLSRQRRNSIDVIKELLGPAHSQVQFPGAVPLAKVPSELAQVDICVFPSIWENFPNACLEAMAAGRGIVASNAGGMADMLADDAGLLVPPRSPQTMAEALSNLLLNPAKRIELGRQARRRLLENYNKDRIGALMEEAFKAAVSAHYST